MAAFRKFAVIALLVPSIFLIGCSDDDDDPMSPGDPSDPTVTTIVVAPDSVVFNNVGEDLQFDADTFDQNGAPIDAEVDWDTSNPNVVTVDSDGNALATGLGCAQVYAISGTVIDSAEVTVTLDGATLREWVTATSGDWENAANWSGGVVPGPGEIAAIALSGNYTVTINGDVNIMGLVLGDGSGSQVLDVGGSNLQTQTGGQLPGAQMLVDNTFTITEDFVWAGGDVSGAGTIQVQSGAMLHVTGAPVDVDAAIENRGTMICRTESSLRVNESLDITPGGLLELQGTAFVSVQFDGVLTSTGTILKSIGEEEARIVVSTTSNSDLNSSGPIIVRSGSLNISGGTLRGRFEIDEDAVLRQSGTTNIESANTRGRGPFMITGRVNIGTFSGQVVSIYNLILDSGSSPSISGVASLLVDNSFVWRRGSVNPDGNLNSQIGSITRFEDGGPKSLIDTDWFISGFIEGDNAVDLTLSEGSRIVLDNNGRWMQDGAGSIRQGVGAQGSLDVVGTFQLFGEGAFNVATGLRCWGTLDLRETVLAASGDFVLEESGVITGGGTDDLTRNLRLNVINANSSVLRGTVRPDLDGRPARLDIQGSPTLEPTFVIEVDVVTNDPFDTESVYFLTGGQLINGTIDLNVVRVPVPGVEYQVVYAFASQDTFEVINDQPFTEIVQDGNGVVCIR